MGWWLVGADTLARSRFVVSPLAETVARLMDLEAGTAAYPGERLWRDTHLRAYRARLAADPVAAAVVRAGFGAHWTADFLTPAPVGEAPLLEEELARLRATPAETAHADLAVSLGGPLPAGLRRADVVERAAGLLEWVWAEAVRPYWPRWRRIVEADIVARTKRLSRGGWAAVLAGTEPRPAPGPLGALLGAARAEVLLLLGSPRSTTHLVALTGQGLGSVGRHLKVLHEAGLIRRRRAGRSVLYRRTEAGESLVRAGSGT
ncbi:helix-turn-helix domain-containing protein [Streptomyces albidoflavus]|uniref:ArsR/SmtB family transcription factor n=1 Tax=Streptomyces albidoflavus TaxID=1886 RepID=UPI00340C5F85